MRIVITGANRGIGLALSQQYHQSGHEVIALCRRESEALRALGVEVHTGVDTASENCANQAREALGDRSIDVLINNAGILRNEQLGTLDFGQISEQFQVNTLGPLRISEALLPLMSAGSRLVFITSRMGSIADNTSGGRYGYRMSKCALNIAAVSLARDLTDREIAVAILHPGLVGTEMIGGQGDVTPDEAAQRLIQRISETSPELSGVFRHANGETLPW